MNSLADWIIAAVGVLFGLLIAAIPVAVVIAVLSIPILLALWLAQQVF